MQVPGAKEVGVEFFSMSKSYSMPGWRLAFAVGNAEIIGALTKLKSYLDYGVFQPIQIAGIIALNECTEVPKQIREIYRTRRDVLCDGLERIDWPITRPPATMFAWAQMPDSSAPWFARVLEFLVREQKCGVTARLRPGRATTSASSRRAEQRTARLRGSAKTSERAGPDRVPHWARPPLCIDGALTLSIVARRASPRALRQRQKAPRPARRVR